MSVPYQYDRLAVCSACLADLLWAWVRRFEAAHDAEDARSIAHSYVASAKTTEPWRGRHSVALLAERTGASPRRVYGVLNGDTATTSLSLADELLLAIDGVYLLRTLTVFRRMSGRLPGYFGGHICTHDLLAVETAAHLGVPTDVVEPSLKGSDVSTDGALVHGRPEGFVGVAA